jgi:CheY-like chemotaxis protein
MRVLVVEDDRAIGGDVERGLVSAGFLVDRIEDGEGAWFAGDTEDYAACVLDLGLPGLDGLTVLRKWRAATGPRRSRGSKPAPTIISPSRSSSPSWSPEFARWCAAPAAMRIRGSKSAGW